MYHINTPTRGKSQLILVLSQQGWRLDKRPGVQFDVGHVDDYRIHTTCAVSIKTQLVDDYMGYAPPYIQYKVVPPLYSLPGGATPIK